MKTVLIVEDEKMIRQGIRTMVQRSGVPVEIIMECNNGEAALAILREQKIDVMFTDIRMPKMDGIELVNEIQKLENKPLIVAISGYDDFSYAVEMLRNGVMEYILKPVERQKITQILTKLEHEIKSKNHKAMTEMRISKKQIKYLLTNEETSEEEISLLLDKYEAQFFKNGYRLCVAGKDFRLEEGEEIFFVDDIPDRNLCIVEQEILPILLKNELLQKSAGISGLYHGLRKLKTAYQEAVTARKNAFYEEKSWEEYSFDTKKVRKEIMQQILKLVEEQAWAKRLQLIGTDKTEELDGQWRSLFQEMKKNRIPIETFETGMENFLSELCKIYSSAIGEEEKNKIDACRNIYQFRNISDYQDYFLGVMNEIHSSINDREDSSRNQQKIKMAVNYIEDHYNQDLNMAVVSNYISMNYSLFSYEFKQYTGRTFVNFLKDIRMSEAKRLLQETDERIIDISRQIGYENEKHFMKIFKVSCGVSPTEYRKNMRQE